MRYGVCDGVRGDVNVFTPNPQLKVYPVVVGINHYQAHSAEHPIDLRNCFESYPAGLEHAVVRVMRCSMSRLMPA